MIEQREDSFRRRHRRLHDVVFFREIANWLIHALDVLNESDDHSRLDGARQHLVTSIPEQQSDAERAKYLDHGEKHRVIADAAQEHVAIAKIHLLKPAVHLCFLSESLDRGHSGNVFLQAGVESAQDEPALAINFPSASA